MTCIGDSVGYFCSSTAAAPLTTAAACDVPLPLKKRSPIRADGYFTSAYPPGLRSETIDRPGAITSGALAGVVPWLLRAAAVSSAGLVVPFGSVAPTVMMYGLEPGLRMLPPVFPDAMTTLMPARYAFSTASL